MAGLWIIFIFLFIYFISFPQMFVKSMFCKKEKTNKESPQYIRCQNFASSVWKGKEAEGATAHVLAEPVG